jgi:hypothetical protein
MLRAEEACWELTEILVPVAHLYRDEACLDLAGYVTMRTNTLAVTSGAHFSVWLPVVTGFAEYTAIPTVRRKR